MPDAYQPTGGGDLGTLLRMIQEEKSSSILNQPPASDPASPIRATTQGPLLSPEAPGGTRVASLRPEGLGSVGNGESSVVAPGSPISGVSSSGGVVKAVYKAPVAAAPGPSVNPGGGGGQPSSPVTKSSPALPSIGTKVTSAPQSVLSAKTTAPVSTPTRSRVGGLIATAPQKTFVGTTKGQNSLDKLIDAALKKLPGTFTQQLFPKLFA